MGDVSPTLTKGDSPKSDHDEKLAERWRERKSTLIEAMLGKEHDMVMHAIIPYSVGGGLDLYDYPNDLEGTGIATKELSDLPGQGSSNEVYRCYELVMFTRQELDLEAAHDEGTPFGRIHATINAILNCIAPYSARATLNPNEICEFPAEMPDLGGRCLIFDGYGSRSDDMVEDFGLLAIIEIFRSEMEYAREFGGALLLERLKDARHYPYSDMDREPVA